MEIEFEEHGHQHFKKYKGEVIQWTQTVEAFQTGHNQVTFFQVPAVLIKLDNKHIELVSLKRQYHHIERMKVLYES